MPKKFQKTFLVKPEKVMFQDLSIGQMFCTNSLDDNPEIYMKVSNTRGVKLSGGSIEHSGESMVQIVRKIPNEVLEND